MNFWLFLIVFVPISCFKLTFLRKGIMGCESLNISLKLLSMFNMCQCLFIVSFMFGSTELYITENGTVSLRLGLHCFKSNDLSKWSTLSICFLAPIHCSSFQQIFLSGLGNVFCIPWRLSICLWRLNELLTIRDTTFLRENGCPNFTCK